MTTTQLSMVKTIVNFGSGNVAIYAAEKAMQLGGKVVAMSDSNGWIYDEAGVDLAVIKEIKEVKRGRIKEYVSSKPNAKYTEGRGIWSVNAILLCPALSERA